MAKAGRNCATHDSVDTPVRGQRGGFELHRADIAERLMQPLPFIEDLDELKRIRAPRPAPRPLPDGKAKT
jgi:hypothetical protein